MKKIAVFLALMFLICLPVFAASIDAQTQGVREWESYVDTGYNYSVELTLSGTPGTVTTITLPAKAKGFKLYPQSYDVRFAVSQTVVAKTTSSGQTVAETDLVVGGIAKANQWEIRLLPSSESIYSPTARTLRILSATGSVVVELETF